jgi:hypothetical protein
MRRGIFAALLLAGGALPVLLARAAGHDLSLQHMDVTAYPIKNFKIGSSETRFGRLEFVGGLEMTSASRDLGGLSALRFLDAGSEFIGVADTGFWFAGKVERSEDSAPAGISGFRMRAMPDPSGTRERLKWEADAEGLLVKGGTLTASFERVHRISSGKIDAQTLQIHLTDEALPVPEFELRSNKGFETLALSPESGPLAGARVAVTEKSLNKKGDIFAGVMEGPKKGIFFVARNGAFDITDGDFLPDGDLLLLERRFNMADGIAMRLTLVKGSDIEPGATVSGETLFEADMGYQIDNMEALDVWQDAAGATRVTLLSDDNHSILQRNILLEFKLDSPSGQAAEAPRQAKAISGAVTAN